METVGQMKMGENLIEAVAFRIGENPVDDEGKTERMKEMRGAGKNEDRSAEIVRAFE